MSMLKKAGIVRSVRGAGGGYVLVKRLEDISVGDVLREMCIRDRHWGWILALILVVVSLEPSP